MKRFLIACVVLFSTLPALAQKTPMPFVLQQYLNGNGQPYASSGMCVYGAGSSTLATTYTTAGGGVANANPLPMDSAGRPSSNGFFGTPGVSYKLVFVDFTGISVPSCSPINGVTVFTQDNIMPPPASSGVVEIPTAIAGESISAGDAVYLSDGQGSRTAGRWYKTDADFAYASSEAPFVGVAPVAIASAATGTVVPYGLLTLSGPFTPSSAYFASATAGATTATAPTNARVIGTAQSTTAFLVSPFNAYRLPNLSSSNILNAVQLSALVPGRCSLTTGLAVTTADVTAATTVYYALMPGQGTSIGLYTGTFWQATTIAQLSIAVPATTNTMYDLWVDYNDGTPVLAVTAWTNDTTRATALTTQDNVYVKTGDTQQRYVCSFRTTAVSGQTEDSFAKRFVSNYYNQVPRSMRVIEATNSWNYITATWRQANASAANQVAFVVGVAGNPLTAHVTAFARQTVAGSDAYVAVGLDSITAPTTGNLGMAGTVGTAQILLIIADLEAYPAVGYHYAAWLESGDGAGAGTVQWFGDNNTPTLLQAGISAVYLQ